MVQNKTNDKKKINTTNNKTNKTKSNDDELQTVVVLKLDMHCVGCVNKIVKCVKSMQGVECAKPETEASKLTVIGKVDPLKLKEKLEFRTKKKVDLITPLAKKDKENKAENNNDNKNKKKKKSDEKVEKKTEIKKAKEQQQMTTAVLKVALHCQGCIDKINRIVTRFKGVLEMLLDKKNDQITVKGTMDAKALAKTLRERLKRAVEIVQPPKKEKEDSKSKSEGDKEGEEKKENGGKKEKNGGGNEKMEESKMEHTVVPSYGYTPYVYGYPGYIEHLHAPQMFSDENPNACSTM